MNAHHRALVLATLAAAVAIRGAAMQSGGASSTEWPAVGGDGGNARYSTLAQITTSNVTKLGAAWTARLDSTASSRAMAVVKDGMIFVTAPPSVYAFDAKTGAPVWRFQDPQLAQQFRIDWS
jgi:glucose dehydrogenase